MHRACLLTLLLILCPVAHVTANDGDEKVRAAGCYIATGQGVVMAVGRFNGRLQLPAGAREAGESPACTARRETLEETGLMVQVAERVGTRKGGRFLLFRCLPEDVLARRDFRPLDLLEIREVLVLNPSTLRNADGERIDTPWRFPEDRRLLTTLFERGEPANPRVLTDLTCAHEQRTTRESAR